VDPSEAKASMAEKATDRRRVVLLNQLDAFIGSPLWKLLFRAPGRYAESADADMVG
jgi:hypothetical protein